MRTFKILLFVSGLILLGLNITGFFKSMRNPEIYTEKNTSRINDVTIKYPEIKKKLIRQKNETDKDFAIRVNEVINKGFSHYWHNEGISKYHLRVPVWENYILWAAGSISPSKYRKYEFCNYEKNLERGVGLCSTHSIVVKGVLNDNDIDASLWDIAGHVVVRAKVGENEWYILDPDFGVVIPYDIPDIEADPEIVRPYYKDMANLYRKNARDPYTTDHVVELYEKKGNHIYTMNGSFENFTYLAIWIIPLLMIFPLILEMLKQKKDH
jgi:hypothetical protein